MKKRFMAVLLVLATLVGLGCMKYGEDTPEPRKTTYDLTRKTPVKFDTAPFNALLKQECPGILAQCLSNRADEIRIYGEAFLQCNQNKCAGATSFWLDLYCPELVAKAASTGTCFPVDHFRRFGFGQLPLVEDENED